MKLYVKIILLILIILFIVIGVYTLFNAYSEENIEVTYDNFYNMDIDKLKNKHGLSKETTDNMSTEDFLETLLDNKYLTRLAFFGVASSDLFYSDKVIDDENLHIVDLLEREDFKSVILEKEKNILEKYNCEEITELYDVIDMQENFEEWRRLENLSWLLKQVDRKKLES